SLERPRVMRGSITSTIGCPACAATARISNATSGEDESTDATVAPHAGTTASIAAARAALRALAVLRSIGVHRQVETVARVRRRATREVVAELRELGQVV